MSESLNEEEKKRLVELGKAIIADLQCNANGDHFPCRTCRLAAVKNMREYVGIHDTR